MLSGNRWSAVRFLALLASAALCWPTTSLAQTRTYTLDDDFDEGILINVNHDAPNGDQLQLDEGTEPFNFIWAAASGLGTIVKIDTRTGAVLGEYWSSPAGMGRNPSRTTVDANGNVWAGNRDEAGGGWGSVIQIGLLENGQCIDRDGDGIIQTSTGLGDVLDWTNAGGADTWGGASTALDECIIKFVRVHGDFVRHVSVDANNNVWTGGHFGADHYFDLLDGTTGAILGSFDVGCGGYGGLVDGNGVLWSASRNNYVLRRDTKNTILLDDDTYECIYSLDAYGLGIDSGGNIWNSKFTLNSITKFSPAGVSLGTFATHGASHDRGVAVTPDDNVWVANSEGSDVSRLNNDGGHLATVTVGSNPTGVAVDAAGKVWATNEVSDNLSRIDPATNLVDLTVPLRPGSAPYNYSDMTGSIVPTAPTAGTWSVVYDAGSVRPFTQVSWTAYMYNDAQIGVQAASSLDPLCLSGFGTPVAVVNGTAPGVDPGHCLMVDVSFLRASTGETPILHDLTIVANHPPVADANGPYLAAVGQTIQLDGIASTDADGDPLTYAWTYDGATTASATGPTPDYTAGSEAGIFDVSVVVHDGYEASDPAHAIVVIYDPDAGFVTGGGWILSPLGACVDTGICIDAEGRASFGFVSKYKKGRSVPEGNTEFQFKNGGLNFHSSLYDWLVVAGAKAMYKGSGTVNGAGDYGFMLSAIDASLTPSRETDAFRIQIFHKDTKAVIYDNQVSDDEYADPVQGIEQGNIVIHTGGKAKKADLAADGPENVPETYELRANYPNPFNPETTITFGLPESGKVRLVVFDLLGREVRVLVDGEMDAGDHAVTFDASLLPSGTYIYRMEAGARTLSRTMFLLK